MNLKLFAVALRNVLKNKRRTLLNMLTFSVSVLTILWGFGLLKGQFDAMFDRIIDLKAGHIKIYNRAFPEEKRTLPLEYNIENPEKVINAIKNAPHFKAASARIVHGGTVSNGKKKLNVIIHGVNFERERQIVSVFDSVDGRDPDKKSAQVMAGRKMARDLSFVKEDSLLLFSQTLHNANNLTDAGVAGVYEAGFEAMEKVDLYLPFEFASDFFDMDGRATEIIVRLDAKEHTEAAKKYIEAVLQRDFPGLTVLDWKEENPELIETAEIKYKNFSFMAMILLFLSFFIIMNTMTMTVFERVPEIGTLRAIGMDKVTVLSMFLAEGLILAVLGAFAGFILSAPLIYFMNAHGIQLDPEVYSGYNLPMDSNLKAINRPSDWLYALFICLSAGVLGSLAPALRASKLNIVSALKKGVR